VVQGLLFTKNVVSFARDALATSACWRQPGHSDGDERLEEWIREHKVTCEVLSHFEMHGTARVRVGYDLTLSARHPLPLHDDPGCPECYRIHDTLRELALRALPDGRQVGRVAIAPFHAALHMRPESRWNPEVLLEVEVRHPHGTFSPPEAEEEACVRKAQQTLAALGVRDNAWGDER